MILKKGYIVNLVNSILADTEMGIIIKGKIICGIIKAVSPEKVMIANDDHKINDCKKADYHQWCFPGRPYFI